MARESVLKRLASDVGIILFSGVKNVYDNVLNFQHVPAVIWAYFAIARLVF